MEEEAAPEAGAKEEADARSVFVNNVDFGTTPEELQQLFAGCGTVNRVTILADKFGTPKVGRWCHSLYQQACRTSISFGRLCAVCATGHV